MEVGPNEPFQILPWAYVITKSGRMTMAPGLPLDLEDVYIKEPGLVAYGHCSPAEQQAFCEPQAARSPSLRAAATKAASQYRYSTRVRCRGRPNQGTVFAALRSNAGAAVEGRNTGSGSENSIYGGREEGRCASACPRARAWRYEPFQHNAGQQNQPGCSC